MAENLIAILAAKGLWTPHKQGGQKLEEAGTSILVLDCLPFDLFFVEKVISLICLTVLHILSAT